MTVNVDPAEIAKFSELAHRWWDPTSEFRPLHEINPLRWDHIDFGPGWWTIPSELAKNGMAHRVPLSRQARAVHLPKVCPRTRRLAVNALGDDPLAHTSFAEQEHIG